MEEGRQVLDLAAPRPKLEHPAAVQPDLVRLAVGVEVEQLAEKTEARRLDVQGERREGETLDVVDRVNRRVPGDSVAVWPQDLLGLRRQSGILEPGLGKRLDDAPVERDVRRSGIGICVERLEVHDVDGAGRGKVTHELVRPPGHGVELEAQLRIELEPAAKRLGRRRIAETGRDEERD